MSNLMNWLANTYAAMAILPFLSFILVWLVCYLVVKNKKKSTKIAVDGTTLFLWGAVYILCKMVLSSVLLFWLIVLFLLILSGLIGWGQNQKRGSIDSWKIFRIVWRIAFLPLAVSYLLLILAGIVQYLFKV